VTGPRTPDVAVVLIGFNDAERLPTAVASVMDQTLSNLELIIVDDASTDGMGQLAQDLASTSSKISYVRLTTNSGGCSTPRNVGLDHVRAPHVMFLDSDDVLDRHACKNLLLASERTGADFVSGRCLRVDMDTGRERSWMKALYDEPRVWNGVRENPELINDTLCTNKLYRMAFLNDHGIRFPVGLHYEDLAFTAEAYCSATRIAVIPEVVYRWQIYHSYPQASIHRQRENIGNFRDRLSIHRIVDEFLRREGIEDMKAFTDARFLRTELRMYLSELADRDPTYQQEWMRLAGDYLRDMDETRILGQARAVRLATYLIRRGNLALSIEAAKLWAYGKVTVPLVQRGKRVYYSDAYTDDPNGRKALDVTWLHAHDARFDGVPLYATVAELHQKGSTIRLRGAILNQLGRIPHADGLVASLKLRRTRMKPRQAVDVPVRIGELDGDWLSWEVEIDVSSLPRGRRERANWFVTLRLAWSGQVNTVSVTVLRDALPSDHPSPSVNGSRDVLSAEVSDRGNLVLADNRPASARPIGVRIQRGIHRSGPARATSEYLTGRALKTLVYRLLLRRLPIRPRTVVFESHLGKQYSDNPRYIYEAMVAEQLPYRCVWSYRNDPAKFPDRAIRVRRDSWRYYYEVARAGYIVDNQGLPAVVVRRPGQRYVQTWHGSPFKQMGFDEPRLARAPDKTQRALSEAVNRWDDFVVMSSWSDKVFRDAFRLKTNSLRTGYPRNDRLFQAGDETLRSQLRQQLGLPSDRKILLYAPTFRRYPRPLTIGNPRNTPHLDLAAFEEALGDQWFVVVRAHYLDRVTVRRRYLNVARNMSSYDDVTDLLLVSDALLTDYSSVMFDYSLTGRPMAFYTSDYELYKFTRGSYFELMDESPGPNLNDTNEILAWLSDLESTHERYHERYQAFRERYCEFEDGKAAEKIIREVFANGPSSSRARPGKRTR
jgi:CDP-glycerol glycerophosphotransferase